MEDMRTRNALGGCRGVRTQKNLKADLNGTAGGEERVGTEITGSWGQG